MYYKQRHTHIPIYINRAKAGFLTLKYKVYQAKQTKSQTYPSLSPTCVENKIKTHPLLAASKSHSS